MNRSSAHATLLEHWPDALILADQQKCALYFSKQARAILGIENESSLGKPLHELLCARTRELLHDASMCQLCEADEGGDKIHSTHWIMANGEYLPIDYRIFPLQLPDMPEARFAISFRSTQQDLHNQVELETLAQYIDCNPAPLAELDTEGNILFANRALQELLLEYEFNEDGLSRLLPEDTRAICQCVARDNRSVTDVDVAVNNHTYRWHFHPLNENNKGSVLSYGFDITAQRTAEREASQARAAARRDFYAKMLHELRTPLNAIVGFSELLELRSDNLDDRDRQRLNAIKSAGLQLNGLITDTLDLSKLEAGKLQVHMSTFSLADIMSDLNTQMAGLAEVKKLSYSSSVEENFEMYSDPQKLKQILINLISNSIKYTKNGWVKLNVRKIFDYRAEFIVSDSGIGIPEEKLGTLFRDYEQIDDKQNDGITGTGLGLALVDQFVRMLGGDIRVESVYGEGTRFILQLPLQGALEQGAAQA